MTENDMQSLLSPVQVVNMAAAKAEAGGRMMLEAGAELNAAKESWSRERDGSWTDHVGRVFPGGIKLAQQLMKAAKEFPQLAAGEKDTAVSFSVLRSIAYMPDSEEKQDLKDSVLAGEKFTREQIEQIKRDAKAEAQKDASADIQKRERAISKLRAQLAALESDDKGDILKDLAAQLDEERAARVKAEAIAEAASKNLSVVAPKVIHTTDPEQAARLAKAEREAADLADQLRKARETLKVRDEQIAKADEVAIRNVGERMRNSAPAEFVTTFCTQTTEEYLRRLRGAVQVANKAPHLFTPELTIPLQEVRDLLNAIEDACAIVQVA